MERVAISHRIKEGLEIRNMKQIDLSRLTGISRSMITEYLKGKYEPRQDNIYLIAKALDVNEAWLMGFDVKKDRNDTSINKNIFVSNLNMMMIIDLRAYGDYIYNDLHISKERMDALLAGNDDPTLNELKELAKHLNIPQEILLSVDLSSENGKYYLDKWAEEKKDSVLMDNEFVLENSGSKAARKNIIDELLYHLNNLNLNALIKLYDYISALIIDKNNLDEEELGIEDIIYEDDGCMSIKRDAFEKLKEDTKGIKESNENVMNLLKSILENGNFNNK